MKFINIKKRKATKVASRVKHQSNKLGLHRHSGSNPGGGVSTFFTKLQDNSRK